MLLVRSSLSFVLVVLGFVATAHAQAPAAPTSAQVGQAPEAAAAPVEPAPAAPPAAPAPPAEPTALPAASARANPPGALPISNAAPSSNPVPPAEPAKAAGPPQLKLEASNGTSIRFGLLWQGAFEARGNSANDDLTKNLYLRRFALLIGGTVLKDLEYFFDSDFADLLKAPTGEQKLKNGPAIQTKDAFVTYKVIADQFKIDGGLMLPAGTHNFLQGGGSLYAWDFFLNTFRFGNAFGSTNNPYGRDVGAQLRGIVADGLLEYRLGVFQGRRNTPVNGAASRNGFRYAARVQLNFLDPEPNYFYAGTYLGTKKIFSVGASADFQEGSAEWYRAFAGDAFLDLPAGPGALTAQVNLLYRNGGSRVTIPSQQVFMAEAGYRFDAIKLSPIGRFERRWGDAAAARESDFGGGLAFWPFGHNSNLKAFYTRLVPEAPLAAYDQFNLQWQVSFY